MTTICELIYIFKTSLAMSISRFQWFLYAKNNNIKYSQSEVRELPKPVSSHAMLVSWCVTILFFPEVCVINMRIGTDYMLSRLAKIAGRRQISVTLSFRWKCLAMNIRCGLDNTCLAWICLIHHFIYSSLRVSRYFKLVKMSAISPVKA